MELRSRVDTTWLHALGPSPPGHGQAVHLLPQSQCWALAEPQGPPILRGHLHGLSLSCPGAGSSRCLTHLQSVPWRPQHHPLTHFTFPSTPRAGPVPQQQPPPSP